MKHIFSNISNLFDKWNVDSEKQMNILKTIIIKSSGEILMKDIRRSLMIVYFLTIQKPEVLQKEMGTVSEFLVELLS